jgi:cysteine desulfurase family protein (TIGR01976 family)
MSTLTFHLGRALGRSYEPGDEIVITELDHHANVAPWQALAKERGVKVRMAKMNPESGQLDWDDLAAQLNRRTKLIAIGAASNALGTITDVQRAAEMAHSIGAQIFVDAVHYAPHELVYVRELDCDFLACSAYKFYGPHIGVLYGRRDLLASLDFPKLLPAPDTAPERAETGTQNHEGIAGAAAAVNFLASLGQGAKRRECLRTAFAELHERGAALVTELWNGLATIENIRVFGPNPNLARTPTVAFVIDGMSSTQVARELADRALFVSNGDFYAATVVARLGQSRNGLVRAGCACYSTEEEVERLVTAVREIARANHGTVLT